jgi:hypothetical protein
MNTTDVDAIIEIVKTFNSNGSIDMNLGDSKRTETSYVKACGIRISDHDLVANCVIAKVVASILAQVIAINESLMAFTDEVIVGQHRDRQKQILGLLVKLREFNELQSARRSKRRQGRSQPIRSLSQRFVADLNGK